MSAWKGRRSLKAPWRKLVGFSGSRMVAEHFRNSVDLQTVQKGCGGVVRAGEEHGLEYHAGCCQRFKNTLQTTSHLQLVALRRSQDGDVRNPFSIPHQVYSYRWNKQGRGTIIRELFGSIIYALIVVLCTRNPGKRPYIGPVQLHKILLMRAQVFSAPPFSNSAGEAQQFPTNSTVGIMGLHLRG